MGHSGAFRLIRRHPFVTLAGFTGVFVAVWSYSGLEYDEGTAGFLFFIIGYVLLVPFQLAAALVTAVVGNSPYVPALYIPLAIAFYVLADLLLAQWRLRQRATSSTV